MVAKRVKQSKVFLGIDVSKATLDLSLNGKHSRIANTEDALDEWIEKHVSGVKVTLCTYEPTGGYEKLARHKLRDAGVRLYQVHPTQAKRFAEMLGTGAKTDKTDAKVLEKYAAFCHAEGIPDKKLPASVEALQELRSAEHMCMETIHQAQCNLHMTKGKAREV